MSLVGKYIIAKDVKDGSPFEVVAEYEGHLWIKGAYSPWTMTRDNFQQSYEVVQEKFEVGKKYLSDSPLRTSPYECIYSAKEQAVLLRPHTKEPLIVLHSWLKSGSWGGSWHEV